MGVSFGGQCLPQMDIVPGARTERRGESQETQRRRHFRASLALGFTSSCEIEVVSCRRIGKEFEFSGVHRAARTAGAI